MVVFAWLALTAEKGEHLGVLEGGDVVVFWFGVSARMGSARLARVRRGKGEVYEKGEEKQVEDGRVKGDVLLRAP